MTISETARAYLRNVKSIARTCLFALNLLSWRIRRSFARDPVIHVYAACYNEEKILPYFLRHYGRIASKIVIYDNESTDRSVEIIKSYPNTEVIAYQTSEKFDEFKLVHIRDTAWKKSRGKADWVIVVDADEFLYHPDLAGRLKSYRQKGVTISVPEGFDMVSDTFPKSEGMIYDEVKSGVKNKAFDKPCIFDPNAIYETNYWVGCHTATPKGVVNYGPCGEFKLLHFRFLGLDYLLERQESGKARLSEDQIKHGFNSHFLLSKDQVINWFNEKRKAATRVMP